MSDTKIKDPISGGPQSSQSDLANQDSLPNKATLSEATAKEKKGIFLLWYRTGMNPHAQFYLFSAGGDFRTIVERAKVHCERMNYRFHMVRPAFVDFDEEEKRLGQG